MVSKFRTSTETHEKREYVLCFCDCGNIDKIALISVVVGYTKEREKPVLSLSSIEWLRKLKEQDYFFFHSLVELYGHKLDGV